ncbi:MAG: gamma-glutamyltransferase family protein [Egibacteraceae bacterium]
MVASTHWLASAVGMRLLELGGNAFDAAVAAGFVLQVVEPHSNGPGGEVPILLATAGRGPGRGVFVVNGQGPAPAEATIDHFASLGLDVIPGSGLLPACVPAAFDAWMLLLAEFGTKTVGEVLAPAIACAEHGYPVLPQLEQAITGSARLFRGHWPSSASVWLHRDKAPAAGSLWRSPDLATTYRRVVTESEAAGGSRGRQIEAAREAWYRGFVAEAIARFVDTTEAIDSTGRRHRGLLTGDDLASFQARLEPPVTFDYHGYTVCKTNTWGQGPVFLQQLALLSGFDLAAMGPESAEFVHTVVACAKLAFADREAWYGDPDHADVPLSGLLDNAYADARRALVGEEASFELRPGSVGGREPPPLPGPVEAGGWGDPTRPPAGDTVHLDVVDRWGNVVSATPSGGWLQSSPTVPGLGFCLGTRGQMFWLTPEHPNALAGGKRPRTTLSPSLALRDGEPCLAFGTPGGDTQDQWTLTFFLRHVHFGANLQATIDTPMFHTEGFPSSFHPRRANPGSLIIESRFRLDAIDALRARGHTVTIRDPWSLGRITAAGRDPAGLLRAAADPRGIHAYAVGR